MNKHDLWKEKNNILFINFDWPTFPTKLPQITYIFAFGLTAVTVTTVESGALVLAAFPMTTEKADPGVLTVNYMDRTDGL